jgi:hypothetical protein
MTAGQDIRRSLHGAMLLARGEVAGMGWLDLSFEGFWRSFAAPLLAAPAYALVIADQYVHVGYHGPLAPVLVGEAVSYAIQIVAFPLLAMLVTRFLGLGARYVPLVVATNWASLPQVAAYLAACVLGAAFPPLRSGVLLGAMLATLAYEWFVIRTALGTSAGNAAAFVVLNLLVGLLLNHLVDVIV